MISLFNAEMVTVESLLECRSKTWEERCSNFSSNWCKDQCRHWEYVTARASLSWIIQSCILLLLRLWTKSPLLNTNDPKNAFCVLHAFHCYIEYCCPIYYYNQNERTLFNMICRNLNEWLWFFIGEMNINAKDVI